MKYTYDINNKIAQRHPEIFDAIKVVKYALDKKYFYWSGDVESIL